VTTPTSPPPGTGTPTGHIAGMRGVRARVDDLLGHPVVGVPVRTAILLAVAFVVEVLLLRITHLPDTAYGRPVLLLEVVRRIGGAGVAGLLVGLACVGAVCFATMKRSPGPDWTDFEHGARLRLLITLQAAILAWVYALQDYNFHFAPAWSLDRLLVVAAVALVAWRPAFILPFLVVLLSRILNGDDYLPPSNFQYPIFPISILCFLPKIPCKEDDNCKYFQTTYHH
jgi:hypothetical protein